MPFPHSTRCTQLTGSDQRRGRGLSLWVSPLDSKLKDRNLAFVFVLLVVLPSTRYKRHLIDTQSTDALCPKSGGWAESLFFCYSL